jgi:hypothetical protein
MTAQDETVIRRLSALTDADIDQLAALLVDCVEGGASVSFMHPLTHDRASAFWRRIASDVAAGRKILFAASGSIGGSAGNLPAWFPTLRSGREAACATPVSIMSG